MWAKINVNYEQTIGGWMSEGLDALTGAPSFTFEPKKLDDSTLWKIINDADKRHEIMATGSNSNSLGIVSSHAYTLIGIATLKKTDGTVVNLMKMRNPWAVERYKGPYSDNDPIWKEADYAKQVGFVGGNDGSFFIDMASFKTSFFIM